MPTKTNQSGYYGGGWFIDVAFNDDSRGMHRDDAGGHDDDGARQGRTERLAFRLGLGD